jgi:hypothetical protein
MDTVIIEARPKSDVRFLKRNFRRTGDDAEPVDTHQFVFDMHLKQWKEKTMFLSSTKSIIENEDFKTIVAMGKSAVPYIINEIENTPSALVWALNIIFNRKISDNPDTTITEACKLWVKELKK